MYKRAVPKTMNQIKMYFIFLELIKESLNTKKIETNQKIIPYGIIS
jgi:hypothetical protein